MEGSGQKPVEEALADGSFAFFEPGMDSETPVSYEANYANWLKAADDNLTCRYPSVGTAISCLIEAELTYSRGQKDNVELPLSELQEAFKRIVASAKSVDSILSILSHSSRSKLCNLSDSEAEQMTVAASKEALKKLRFNAKRAYKDSSYYGLHQELDKLRRIRDTTGYFPSKEFENILHTADRKGVQFYLDLANQNEGDKAESFRRTANKNAKRIENLRSRLQ